MPASNQRTDNSPARSERLELLSRRDMLGLLGAAALAGLIGSRPSHASAFSTSGTLSPPPLACGDPLGPFLDEMVEHSRDFAPVPAKLLDDYVLRDHLRATHARSEAWGFTFRGPVRLVIELTFMLGSSFDTDPQFAWASEILHTPGEQMERAERLYQAILAYRQEVTAWAERRATMRWLLASKLDVAEAHPVRDIVRHMQRIFPEKAQLVGPQALAAITGDAIAQAEHLGMFDRQRQALVAGLMFAFGHGCLHDPLLPMIRENVEGAAALGPDAGLAHLRGALSRWLIRSLFP